MIRYKPLNLYSGHGFKVGEGGGRDSTGDGKESYGRVSRYILDQVGGSVFIPFENNKVLIGVVTSP